MLLIINGTAPGYIVEDDDKTYPITGPPSEMKPMFEKDMLPYLKRLQDKVFLQKQVLCGIVRVRQKP